MLKVLSVILEVIGGFFLYMTCMMAFMSANTGLVKLVTMLIPSVVGVLALGGGLALTRFRTWRWDIGVVLLSVAGFTSLVVFTFACLFMTEEFPRMIRPGTHDMFSDYLTGGCFILGFAALGWILVKQSQNGASRDEICE